MHEECNKVEEKHFENHFWPILPLCVALRHPQNQKGSPYGEKSEKLSDSWF